MSKEGAIILGIGGDNSIGAAGTFYEGVMTSGYPSDATENAVQANITAAGYSTAAPGGGGGQQIVGGQSGRCLDVPERHHHQRHPGSSCATATGGTRSAGPAPQAGS